MIKSMEILNCEETINFCCDNGTIFIKFFKQITCSKNKERKLEIANQMQSILNDLNDIVFSETNRHLNHAQKMDWFYTATSNYDNFFDNNKDIELYDKFVLLVEVTCDVKTSLLQLGLL
jgi:hypothetical protein